MSPRPQAHRSPLRLLAAGLIALLSASGAGRAQAADGAKALDEYFKGRVVALEGKVVTLRYDFRDKDQASDWIDKVPFRIKTRKDQGIKWFDSKLEIVGNAGACHKAEWTSDAKVSATWIPDLEKDFGGYMSPVSETEDFATFTFVETYFHAFDGQSGGTNSIIKFGAQWKETDSEDFIGFRYGMRKPPKDPIVVGRPLEAAFGREKGKLLFVTPDGEMKSAEKGKRLKDYRVGFYAINGRLLLDDIVIQGTLSADWLQRENVELRTAKPITEGGPTEVDPTTRALIDEYKAGGSSKATLGLVGVLKDETAGDVIHSAVLEALSTGPKKAVRHVMDLLYNQDERVRARGIHVVKALLGSDYGFKAKASEKSRSAALRKLNKELQDNPGLLDG